MICGEAGPTLAQPYTQGRKARIAASLENGKHMILMTVRDHD